MNYQDVIQGFRSYTKEQAERLKGVWKLSMSVDMLLFCINHYKTQEKRDPSVDELHMLDQLSVIQEGAIGALAPTDLFTNDEFAAETYADLQKKRKEVNPYANYPCTVTEAAKIANAYLLRVGKPVHALAASCIPEAIDETATYPGASCITAGNAAFRLRLLPHASSAPQAGDLLLLLSQASEKSRLRFGKAIEEIFENGDLKKHLKGVYTVKDSGLLYELLEHFSGVRINLGALSAWDETVPMTVLTHQYGASRIVRITKEDLAAVLPVLRGCGMKAVVFAEVTNDGNFAFLRTSGEKSVTLNAQFMRLLFHYKALEVQLADEHVQAPDRIDPRVVRDLSCRYLEQPHVGTDASLVGDILCAAASAAPSSAYFKTALYTALAPVVTLAASGADYTKQAFSVGMEFPADCKEATVAGEVLSTVLGVYRAQTELALVAQGLSIHTDPAVAHPSVTAFALCSGKPMMSEFVEGGHYVYCLAPTFRENGLPDFRTLRTMLERLVAVTQTDTVVSAHVLVNESITDGLRHMSGSVTCRLTDLRVAAEGALPIGVLIESNKPLSYRQVGMTEEREGSDPIIDEATAEINQSLIWSDMPEVVILAKKNDGDARILANVLTERGTHVHLFNGNVADTEPLSRALLGAQTLILCSAALPHDERVRFAFETMRAAGGVCLSLGAPFADSAAFLSFPNGIPEAILEKICSNEKKILKNVKKNKKRLAISKNI